MATISKPNTFSAGAVIVASQHNDNFDTIYNDYNGNITNVNVAASAAIANSKLNLATIAQTMAMSSVAINWAKGTDIASATTTDIGGMAGNYGDVTGTTTITGLGTVQAGTFRIVRFTGALTLTHNATSLLLPNNGSNITTAANDTAGFESLGSGNWKCVWYQKYNGTPLVSVTASTALSGSVIQTVTALLTSPVNVTAVPTIDDTPPLYSEGNEIGSASITPDNASNTLIVEASYWGAASGSQYHTYWINDATGSDQAIAVRRTYDPAAATNCSIGVSIAAGGTSAITFYLVGGVDAGTFYVGRNSTGTDLFGAAAFGFIKIQEIKA